MGLAESEHKRNRTGYSILIPLTIVVTLLVGCLASGTCSAAGNPKETRIGSELDFPPYAFVDEKGQAAGFSIELIKAVADAMGLPVKISTGPWDTMWNSLVSGELDVLPIVAKLTERQRLVDFSLPHTETYDAFFVRKGDPAITNIAAARGKEIVVMRSDAAHHALMEHNFQGKLILVDTIAAGLELIMSGKHNAVLCSKLIGTLSIKKHGITGLTAGPTIPDYKRIFSFAVKKGDTEMLEKLNQGLLMVKTSGEYAEEMAIEDEGHHNPTRSRMLELELFCKDGNIIPVEGHFCFIRDPAGKAMGVLAIMRDITDRKRMEETLRESENKYRELSIIDDLTQLYNSRYFYHQLKIEIDRVVRYGQPLTLMLLDLDDFKRFNDTYGHIEGDQVLWRLGQVIKRCLRQTDTAYRYGGEEFTVLLPLTHGKDGAVTAERIKTELKKETFSPGPDQDVRITVSIGHAQYELQEEMKAFVQRVDQLMYQAKKARNDNIVKPLL